jgi:hypothetical protein
MLHHRKNKSMIEPLPGPEETAREEDARDG